MWLINDAKIKRLNEISKRFVKNLPIFFLERPVLHFLTVVTILANRNSCADRNAVGRIISLQAFAITTIASRIAGLKNNSPDMMPNRKFNHFSKHFLGLGVILGYSVFAVHR